MNVSEVTPVEEPSAWMGSKISGERDWNYHLSQETLADIDRCVERLRKTGASLRDIGAGDFPLNGFADEISAIRRELASGRGFAVIRGLQPSRFSDEELGMIFWGIGTHFGKGFPQSHQGDRLGHVVDLSDEEKTPRVYHAGGKLNMHTDLCDVVALMCLRPAKRGGASRIESAMAVHNLMLSRYPQHMEALYRGFPYRMLDTDAQPTGRNPLLEHPVPVFARSASQLMCCFVPYYIEYAQKFGGVSLSPEDKEALQALISLTEEAGVWMEMEFRPGDIQLLNNRKILHGRADYEDYPEKARRRHLLRLWLAMPEWPEMPINQVVHTNEEKLRWEGLSATPAG